MREVVVIRHAPKDISGKLTQDGKELVQKSKGKLGEFSLIISSDIPRAVETATFLTGEMPHIDKRASIPDFTEFQERELFELGKVHSAGIAGVIFDNPFYRELVGVRGETLAQLIKETLTNLPENGRALIVSHDGSMVAAEKILQNKALEKVDRNYQPLAGYVVNEDLHITYFSLYD